MTREEYVLLYEKCASGNCTEEERTLLKEYRDEFSLEETPWDETKLGNRKIVIAKMHTALRKSIREGRRRRWLQRYRMPAAAAVALLAMVTGYGLYRYWGAGDSPPGLPLAASGLRNDILPGSDKAVLTLEDGSTVTLDSSVNGVLPDPGGLVIRKAGDGQLIYDLSGTLSGDEQGRSTAFNTVATPRGGQYQVVLPDGSKVWLNAASSLKFPVLFSGKERRVELTGEAYFEVAKKADQPFVVATASETVEVLGTHFNVKSYADEALSRTTLVEGSVKVSSRREAGGKAGSRVLVPGQQSVVGPGGISVAPVNTGEAIAWKNGEFMFSNESIEEVMKKIGRWYDVEVVYEPFFESASIWGSVSRFENISEVLKVIELTGSVHFKIEGRRVYLMN